MTDFAGIKQRYGENPLPILRELVGQGKIEGSDYVALDPRRNDSRLGSFRIDIQTGRFHDFATNDKGGSIIDLAMFVYNCGIVEAAQRLESLFPFLAGTSVAADTIPAKKKKLDAVYIWNKSTKAQHQYLNKKKVTIRNARVNLYKGKSQLVIPLTDRVSANPEDPEVKGLQFIYDDGRKIFPLPFMGLFHIASDFDAGSPCGQYSEKSSDTKVCGEITIILAEGYATARSIAQALDAKSIPADRSTLNIGSKIILAAMSSSNMKNVAEKIAEQFPNSEIIIAADNDEAGRKAVTEAQKAISGKVSCAAIYPSPEFNDFNDMYRAVEAEGLRKYFSILDKGNEENE